MKNQLVIHQIKNNMRKHLQILSILTLLGCTTSVLAQQKGKDTLDTGTVNVVKPYTPSVNDAFKVKETPALDDEHNSVKKEVKYNIFSFPVASTFTPAKGNAADVEKAKPVKLFDNYATLGLGTYATAVGELYLNHAISRSESAGGYFSHQSSQGGIQDVLTDDYYYNTKLNANYSQKQKDLSWKVEAGFEHQIYNWYGLPQPMFTQATADTLDVAHTFYGIHVGGNLDFEDTYLKSGSVLFRRFGDDFGSGENNFTAKVVADVPIADEEISTTILIDYLGGSFDKNYFINEELKYGNFQIGLSPTYQMRQDDLTLNLGASLYYLNDTENNENKLYIYPNITATYRVVSEVVIAYGGIEGGLIQNTYHKFANENPFVSPTLGIRPTDKQYDAYIGLKGKLSNHMSYNISGRYMAERFKALYKSNTIRNNGFSEDYHYGNSFGIVYDDVDTYSIAGELSVDVNRNFTMSLKGEYFGYSQSEEAEAWNLPDFKASLFMDYQIDEHWFAGANLFFVGERKDQMVLEGSLLPGSLTTTVTLDSYFDANAHVGYHLTDRWSVFLRGNNLANNDYQRWQNYPVQGFQLLAGATYKFDF